jgi:UPF0716 protein FxsA
VRWLALLFLIVPFVELWLLLRVGDLVGFWPTMGLVLATALLGAWLAKSEGLRVLRDWQGALAQGRLPEEGITSSLLVLVGAVLLATPGVLTDAVGILFLVPPTRRIAARWIAAYVQKRITTGAGSAFAVRVVTPEGVYARRRVVDAEGQVIEDREIRARPGQPAVRIERPGDVLEGEVVDVETKQLPPSGAR